MTIRYIRPSLVASLVLGLLPMLALADSTTPGKVISGWVEKITLTELDATPIKAKLDSGAKTSSLHAENIERFKRDGKTWVRFDYTDSKGQVKRMEMPRYRGAKIKDLDGGFDRRPVIKTTICFDGRYREVEFTLTDRSNFVYTVLLGRRFLQGIAVIDPEKTFLTQARCEPSNGVILK